MKKILFIICLLFSIMIISGCELNGLEDKIKKYVNAKVECTTTNQYKEKYGFGYYIEGSCTNKDEKDIEILEIEYECFDKDNNLIKSVYEDKEGMKKEETWEFNISILSSDSKDIDHCEYKDSLAW